jgi:NAD(P)H-dependent FMN reductase
MWPRKLAAPWVVDDCVDTRRTVLLVSGSLRAGSTNSALLRTAVRLAPAGVEAVLFDGVGRLPPHFDPDQDGEPLHPAVEALRAAIRGCDGILFSTPEYAGALPGAFKNLLEWAVGDADVGSIYDKPVGWINVSASPTGAADAYRSLAIVLGYVHAAVVTEACVRIPVTRQMVGSDGLITDPVVS